MSELIVNDVLDNTVIQKESTAVPCDCAAGETERAFTGVRSSNSVGVSSAIAAVPSNAAAVETHGALFASAFKTIGGLFASTLLAKVAVELLGSAERSRKGIVWRD